MTPSIFTHALSALKNAIGGAPPVAPAPKPVATNSLVRMADDAATQLGSQLCDLGQYVAKNNRMLGLGSVATFATSKALDQAGKYFQREGFRGAVKSLSLTAAKNPLPLAIGAIGVGLVIGRVFAPRKTV